MARTAWKWCVGCGVGCIVIIIAAVSLGVGGLLLARGAVREVKQIADLQEEVERQYGPLQEYAPPYGPIPSARLEAFTQVRGAMASVMDSWDEQDETFPPKEGRKGFIEGLKAIRGGVKAVSTIGRLMQTRNEALLEQKMGFGEYYYLYCTAYYAWLGHSPMDCPRGVSVHIDSDGRTMSFRDEDHGNLQGMYRTTMFGMLRRALASSGVHMTQEGESWRAAVRAELDALEADSGRTPWEDGLPPDVLKSLEPFRDRIQSTYWRASNCLELATLSTDGSWRERLDELEEDGIV